MCPERREGVLDSQGDYDADLWKKVAEMGWTSTVIPEEFGGLGLSYLELVVVAEELGRAVAPIPFGSSVYLATEAILANGSVEQKESGCKASFGRSCWYLRFSGELEIPLGGFVEYKIRGGKVDW